MQSRIQKMLDCASQGLAYYYPTYSDVEAVLESMCFGSSWDKKIKINSRYIKLLNALRTSDIGFLLAFNPRTRIEKIKIGCFLYRATGDETKIPTAFVTDFERQYCQVLKLFLQSKTEDV